MGLEGPEVATVPIAREGIHKFWPIEFALLTESNWTYQDRHRSLFQATSGAGQRGNGGKLVPASERCLACGERALLVVSVFNLSKQIERSACSLLKLY
jgi:hypothetical protein